VAGANRGLRPRTSTRWASGNADPLFAVQNFAVRRNKLPVKAENSPCYAPVNSPLMRRDRGLISPAVAHPPGPRPPFRSSRPGLLILILSEVYQFPKFCLFQKCDSC
jgi:hypothetical protein